MTTRADALLLDTNVLVYALDNSSEHHAASRAILEQAQSPDAGLCVTSQSLAEFYSLVTNPKRVASPRTVDEALATVEAIASLPGLTVLPVPFDVVPRWVELCRKSPVKGARIYDLQIIAVMLANGVQRICTFDVEDFAPFKDIQVEVP